MAACVVSVVPIAVSTVMITWMILLHRLFFAASMMIDYLLIK